MFLASYRLQRWYNKCMIDLIKNNIFKCVAIIVALIGILVAFLAVRLTYPMVIISIIVAFLLIGIFIWCIKPTHKLTPDIAPIIIWVFGGLAGIFVGYRPEAPAGPSPWRWQEAANSYAAVVLPPDMEWLPAILFWVFFLLLGIGLSIIHIRQLRERTERPEKVKTEKIEKKVKQEALGKAASAIAEEIMEEIEEPKEEYTYFCERCDAVVPSDKTKCEACGKVKSKKKNRFS